MIFAPWKKDLDEEFRRGKRVTLKLVRRMNKLKETPDLYDRIVAPAQPALGSQRGKIVAWRQRRIVIVGSAISPANRASSRCWEEGL